MNRWTRLAFGASSAANSRIYRELECFYTHIGEAIDLRRDSEYAFRVRQPFRYVAIILSLASCTSSSSGEHPDGSAAKGGRSSADGSLHDGGSPGGTSV